ncbi:Hypothetical predicted protein, partial [Podarcis lilfordi]
ITDSRGRIMLRLSNIQLGPKTQGIVRIRPGTTEQLKTCRKPDRALGIQKVFRTSDAEANLCLDEIQSVPRCLQTRR